MVGLPVTRRFSTVGSSMEQIVRPWVDVLSFSTPRERPVQEITPPAFLRWGGPSQFNFDNSFRDKASGGIGFRVDDDPDEEDKVINLSEVGRNVSEKRVENPEDTSQYVVVEVIDEIQFQGPNNTKYTFQMRNG